MNNGTQQLEKPMEDWAAAELHGDPTFLGPILTDDFIGIGPRGFTLTKDQWLARYESGDLRYEYFGLDEVRVRLYGGAAVATCNQSQAGEYQGHDVRGSSAQPWSSWRSRGVGCWPAFT